MPGRRIGKLVAGGNSLSKEMAVYGSVVTSGVSRPCSCGRGIAALGGWQAGKHAHIALRSLHALHWVYCMYCTHCIALPVPHALPARPCCSLLDVRRGQWAPPPGAVLAADWLAGAGRCAKTAEPSAAGSETAGRDQRSRGRGRSRDGRRAAAAAAASRDRETDREGLDAKAAREEEKN